MQTSKAKEAAGKAGAELVQEGMLIGIGTGTTAEYFTRHLAVRVKKGLKIKAIATSLETAKLAESYGIPILNIDKINSLDLTVDGADEIDKQNRLIKGGGGALFHEKIVATMSKEMIVIADSSKLVDYLGKFPLPVEIAIFAYNATLHHLYDLGYEGELRKTKDGKYFVTDGGNFIVDIRLKFPCKDPEIENEKIRKIPGVVETGFFFNLAHKIIVGYPDGEVSVRS